MTPFSPLRAFLFPEQRGASPANCVRGDEAVQLGVPHDAQQGLDRHYSQKLKVMSRDICICSGATAFTGITILELGGTGTDFGFIGASFFAGCTVFLIREVRRAARDIRFRDECLRRRVILADEVYVSAERECIQLRAENISLRAENTDLLNIVMGYRRHAVAIAAATAGEAVGSTVEASPANVVPFHNGRH